MKRFAVRILEGYRSGRDLTRFAKVLAGILGPTGFVTACVYGGPVVRFLQSLINTPVGVHITRPGGSNIIYFLLPFVALAIGTLLPLLLVGRALPDRIGRAEMGEVAIGSDGLLVTVRKESRFISYQEIADAYAIKNGRVILQHTDGTRTGVSLESAKALFAALESSRARFAHEAEARLPNVPKAVEAGASAYRGGIAVEELTRVALCPAADLDARVRAIRALADTAEPVQVKLRVAAEQTAAPEVQEAFAFVEKSTKPFSR